MDAAKKRVGSLLVGLYAWLLTLFFGMVLLDVQYARRVPGSAGASSEIADLLLLIVFGTVLTGFAAAAFSWNSMPTRGFLIASLLVILLEILAPVFLAPLIRSSQALRFGPWLRVFLSAAASILAWLAMHRFEREIQAPHPG